MQLQEEYIKRHSLNYKPIYYAIDASIILQLHSRPQIVVNIKWEETARNPGCYTFNYLGPNHNGYLYGDYFVQLGDNHYYQYDEYANFIMRWVKNLNFIAIKSSQVKLAVWEMFLYCFDGWIAEHDLERTVFQTTNSSLSAEKRSTAIDSFLDYLETYDSLVLDIYNSEFRKYEYNYANWLVELIDFYSIKRG